MLYDEQFNSKNLTSITTNQALHNEHAKIAQQRRLLALQHTDVLKSNHRLTLIFQSVNFSVSFWNIQIVAKNKSKYVSEVGPTKRVTFGIKHEEQTIKSCWQYIIFTNELHTDPISKPQGFILREYGTQYSTENIQE